MWEGVGGCGRCGPAIGWVSTPINKHVCSSIQSVHDCSSPLSQLVPQSVHDWIRHMDMPTPSIQTLPHTPHPPTHPTSCPGIVLFTDPPYGYAQNFQPPPQLGSYIWALDPEQGTAWPVVDGVIKPNGLALSPDALRVYFSDTAFYSGMHY